MEVFIKAMKSFSGQSRGKQCSFISLSALLTMISFLVTMISLLDFCRWTTYQPLFVVVGLKTSRTTSSSNDEGWIWIALIENYYKMCTTLVLVLFRQKRLSDTRRLKRNKNPIVLTKVGLKVQRIQGSIRPIVLFKKMLLNTRSINKMNVPFKLQIVLSNLRYLGHKIACSSRIQLAMDTDYKWWFFYKPVVPVMT